MPKETKQSARFLIQQVNPQMTIMTRESIGAKFTLQCVLYTLCLRLDRLIEYMCFISIISYRYMIVQHRIGMII